MNADWTTIEVDGLLFPVASSWRRVTGDSVAFEGPGVQLDVRRAPEGTLFDPARIDELQGRMGAGLPGELPQAMSAFVAALLEELEGQGATLTIEGVGPTATRFTPRNAARYRLAGTGAAAHLRRAGYVWRDVTGQAWELAYTGDRQLWPEIEAILRDTETPLH
jgi:hypothetical protein